MTHQQKHRWVDIISGITTSYNQIVPLIELKPEDSGNMWKLQYDVPNPVIKSSLTSHKSSKRFKYKVGDLIRIYFMCRQFQREYGEHLSRELDFIDKRVMKENIPQYQLKDYTGEIVIGIFYENQLNKAYEQDKYLVDKVLCSRKLGGQKQHLVR